MQYRRPEITHTSQTRDIADARSLPLIQVPAGPNANAKITDTQCPRNSWRAHHYRNRTRYCQKKVRNEVLDTTYLPYWVLILCSWSNALGSLHHQPHQPQQKKIRAFSRISAYWVNRSEASLGATRAANSRSSPSECMYLY